MFYKYSFSKKVAKKLGPENVFIPFLKVVFFSGPSPNPSDKTPKVSAFEAGASFFGKIPPNLGQTDNRQTKSIRIVALDLGSPLRGQKS